MEFLCGQDPIREGEFYLPFIIQRVYLVTFVNYGETVAIVMSVIVFSGSYQFTLFVDVSVSAFRLNKRSPLREV